MTIDPQEISEGYFHFLCGVGGILLYLFTYFVIYRMFIKVYPHEQEQFYLKKEKKKYYCEYESTIHTFNSVRVIRIKLPEKYSHLKIGADLQ